MIPPESAREPLELNALESLKTYINNVVEGLEVIPHISQNELPSALDGDGFSNFEAPADNSLKVGDTFDVPGGLTAEVIGVINPFGSRTASYTVKFYYLH